MTEAITWRVKSLNGIPKPLTSIERRCNTCGASFLLTAPGKTHQRGIWNDWRWYCSMECFDRVHGEGEARRLIVPDDVQDVLDVGLLGGLIAEGSP